MLCMIIGSKYAMMKLFVCASSHMGCTKINTTHAYNTVKSWRGYVTNNGDKQLN